MIIFRAIYIPILFLFFSTAIAQAADQRDLIIQKTMDCVDNHLQQKDGISWNDVCDVPESESYPQHDQAVNQQMDQLEGNNVAPQIFTPVSQLQQKQREWSFEFAPETSYIKYVETVNGSTFVRETGNMSGVNGSMTYHPPVGNTLNSEMADVYRIEGMFLVGKMNYYGGYQNSDGSITPLTFHGINDYMGEVRALFGKDMDFNNQSTLLRPYLGFGYRSLFDESSALPGGGYNRLIQYIYLPIGADVTTHLNNGWSIGANLEYDFFLRGFVMSYLGALGIQGYGDTQNTQDNGGYGVRGSIKLTKSYNNFNLYVEPYVRYWNINASRWDASNPFLGYFTLLEEPQNTSLEIGGKLGIEF